MVEMMILREQENFLLSNLDLSYRRYSNVYFNIICADVVYPPGEKLSLFTHFCSNQRFFMHIM